MVDEPQVTITVGFSSSLSSGLQRGRELINRPCIAQHQVGSELAEGAGLFLSGAFGGCGGGLSQEGPGQEGTGADFLGAVPVSCVVLVQGWGLWHAADWVSDSGAASAVLGADSGLLCGPRVRFQRGLKTPPPA